VRRGRVRARLQRDIRHEPDLVERGLAEGAQWLEPFLAFGMVAGPADSDAEMRRAVEPEPLRQQVHRFRSVHRDITKEASGGARPFPRPADESAENDRIHLVQLVFDGRDDAEVAAAATQPPVQVFVLLGAGP
jgi:hypothetical protein